MSEESNVIVLPLPNGTVLDIPPDRLLEAAKQADLETVVIIGRDKNGDLYFSSTTGYLPEVLWDIEEAKQEVMSMGRRSRDGAA